MELIYKIDFNSTNFYFKNIIDCIIKESKVNANSKMYKGFILLICDDTQENIEKLFKALEERLPLSIFLSNSEVLESFDYEKYEEIEDKDIKINLTLMTNDQIKKILEENHIDFSNDINKIKEGGISRFETNNGLKDFFLPSKKLRELFESRGHEVKLLITNINAASNLLEISQKDLQLLCSIERPLVKLKFKLLENRDKEYSNTRFIYAKIPDDKETVLFSNALKNNGIDFVLYINDDIYQNGLKVTYNDKQNIIINGEKTLFPKYDYKLNRKVICAKDYFDEYGSVFKATLCQFNKKDVPVVGAYFSYNSENSSILINLPEVGQKNIIHIPNIVNSVDNCLEDIKSIDENCNRLVENYKTKFPEFFEKEFNNKNSNGFGTILNILSYLLGMRDYKEFEDTALLYSAKGGIQIDMNLIKIDGKNYLDYRRVIQSSMSYLLAGVEKSMIAYSFYESLSEFLVDNINKIDKEININDLILCGNMFANTILLTKLNKNLKNVNILISKEYPIDL
ncbi:hypothetical protein CRV08_07930 [Halarcobacter ebronensis]|uniref:Carbamoyltransferase Kae1-like domain-containing protein n=1 Tax=Halarcobacter ebronensis TaxID=1462615 RepID=A0A4Q0YDT9_9BACT|nr:hypothetical protein [Halarcobacter ebronensis]RXJ68175.1 hypothetical protein CRV08_07930 [Halarcobacter ebronensis]